MNDSKLAIVRSFVEYCRQVGYPVCDPPIHHRNGKREPLDYPRLDRLIHAWLELSQDTQAQITATFQQRLSEHD